MLQEHAIDKIVRPRLLHLNVNTEPIRGFRSDVKPERFDYGKDDVDFGSLDDHGFNLVLLILEHPVQEILENLFVAQERFESCIKERVEVLVFLDFFDGLIDPLFAIEVPISQTGRHDAIVF